MMKKVMASLCVAATMAVVSVPAFAADNGFYAGVTLGQSRANAAAGAVLTKSTDTVYGILGGYQFTKNWGVEAFYTGAGRWAAQNVPATANSSGKADSWGIVGVGTLPLSDAFSLYGKLGYASTKSTASCAVIATGLPCGAAGPSGATRNAATYGLGGVYNVTPAIGIRFGWDRFSAATTTAGVTNNSNSNVYSLGAVFKF